jgi:hypothetical protein
MACWADINAELNHGHPVLQLVFDRLCKVVSLITAVLTLIYYATNWLSGMILCAAVNSRTP